MNAFFLSFRFVNKNTLIIILLFISIYNSIYGKSNCFNDTLKIRYYFSGIKYGFAINIPFHSQLIYEKAYYYPLILQGKIFIAYHKKPKRVFYSNCLSPQLNPVLVTDESGNYFRYEFGLNVEFGFNYQLSPKNFFYTAIATGPHFINIEKGRQASGFIFSDNIIGVLRHAFNKKTEIIFEFKFRHISNAGLKHPNNGINNYLLGIGILYRIAKE
jgi:hypothetical protein